MGIDKTLNSLLSAINGGTQAIVNLASAIDRYCDTLETGNVSTAPRDNIDAINFEIRRAAVEDALAKGEPVFELQTEAAPVVKPEPEVANDQAEAEAEPVADTPATFDEARKVVIATTQAKGRDVMAGILADMGVGNIKELNDGQFGELIAKCKAA